MRREERHRAAMAIQGDAILGRQNEPNPSKTTPQAVSGDARVRTRNRSEERKGCRDLHWFTLLPPPCPSALPCIPVAPPAGCTRGSALL
jgi:hypothetical protein